MRKAYYTVASSLFKLSLARKALDVCERFKTASDADRASRLSVFSAARIGSLRRAAFSRSHRGLLREVDPILKSVFLSRQGRVFAALLLAFSVAAASPVWAQRRTGLPTVSPQGRLQMSNARFLPQSVTRRSLNGRTGFRKTGTGAAQTRVQVGGANGANVPEKTVDITRRSIPDERTPFWAPTEQFLFYASNQNPDGVTNAVSASGKYQLFRISSAPFAGGASTGASVGTPVTADTAADHLFPAINTNNSRIAYIRSTDGLNVDAAAKKWELWVSNLPTSGIISPATTRARSLTPPNTRFLGKTFDTVGRPSWIGGDDIAFSARFVGEANFHLFTVNVTSGSFAQVTDGAGDERNPSVTPDGRTIAFDSNAEPRPATGDTYTTVGVGLRSEANPNSTPTSASALNPSGKRNIFTVSTLGLNAQQFSQRYAGAIDTNSQEPMWSSSTANSVLNPDSQELYLAFSSTRVAVFDQTDATRSRVLRFTEGTTGDIYYVLTSLDAGVTISPEDDQGTFNAALRIDTSDGDAFAPIFQPTYNDRFPTFAPFINVQRMGFQSDRFGDLAKDGVGNGFIRTPNASDIFIATVVDISAPTLLRYDTGSALGEIVHINLGSTFNSGGSVRTRSDGLLPNTQMFFTVRVEDREAGLRPDKAVYLQFKNPNSKYQSQAQGGAGVEHKEYIHNKIGPFGPLDPSVPAFWAFVLNESGNGGYTPLSWENAATGLGVGVEYECEPISAATYNYFQHRGNKNGGPNAVDYLAGYDDSFAFSGSFFPPLDGADGTPNIWLELKPLTTTDANGVVTPVRPTDGQGGILYGATWKAPAEASDWFIDVIAYDNAANPFDFTQQSNWIIYDNAWGFSTAAPISGPQTDVLVVADYALGQKFFLSQVDRASNGIFGGNPTSSNVSSRLFFGAESYYTDSEVSRFPDGSPAPPPPGSTTLRTWDDVGPFIVQPAGGFSAGGVAGQAPVGTPNALGVGSYVDEYLANGVTFVDGKPLSPIGRYSIWRILSRGSVPSTLLADYAPQVVTQPGDVQINPRATAKQVLSSNRCVVWATPFSGNLFVGPGTITDLQTQIALTNYVNQGGRLFISGQDIAFALVGSGQTNAFFTNVLKATYVQDLIAGTGDNFLTAVPVPATGPPTNFPYIGFYRRDPWPSTNQAFGITTNAQTWAYTPLTTGTLLLNNAFSATDPERRADSGFTSDASLGFNDVVRARPQSGASLTDIPDSIDEFLYPGSPQPPGTPAPFIDPTQPPPPPSTAQTGIIATRINPGLITEGKVVYSSVGFESVAQEFYQYTATGAPAATLATKGRRSILMHNITESFRTGTITGRIIDQNNSPVSNALVRIVSDIASVNIGEANATAITDADGNYQAVGVPPGFYVVFVYKSGFYTQHDAGNNVHGGWRATTNLVLKRANPGSLTGTGNADGSEGGVYRADGVTGIAGVEVQARSFDAGGKLVQFTAITSDGSLNVDGVILNPGAYKFRELPINDPGYIVIANSPDTVDASGALIPNPKYRSDLATERARLNTNTVVLGPGTVIVDGTPADPTDADPRVVIQENQTAQVNFLLASSPQPVSGQVVDAATGAPIANAGVSAVLQNTSTVVATAVTDASGNYTLATVGSPTVPSTTLLPEGTYVITAQAIGYDLTVPATLPAINPVTVTVGGTGTVTAPQIKLTKLPPGSVSGIVTASSGQAGVTGATVKLFAIVNGVRETNPRYQATTGDVQTAADGYRFNYTISGVDPGDYVATVEKTGFVGDPVLFGQFTVTTGQERRNVNFRLLPPKVYGAGIQLISTPFDYSSVDPRSIFGLTPTGDNNNDGAAGQPNDVTIYNAFKIADWRGVGNSVTGDEYNIAANIPVALGKGYFVNFGSISSVLGSGRPNPAPTATITLTNGWNLIGNPFTDPSNLNSPAPDLDLNQYATITDERGVTYSLKDATARGLVRGVAFSYTGSNANSQYVQSGILRAWFGYWFRNTNPSGASLTMTLTNPASGAGASRAAAPPMTIGADGRAQVKTIRTITRAEMDTTRFRSITSKGVNDWRLQIAARQGDLLDTDNSVGVASGAKDGFDTLYDTEKPPMVGNADSIYLAIDGTNEGGRAAPFSDDIRAASSGTQKNWDFTVQATGKDEVTLFWPNINRLPRGLEPMLVDTATGRRTPMRSASSYQFQPLGGRAVQRFRIEVAAPSSQPFALLNLKSTKVSGRAADGTSGGYRFSFTATREAEVSAEIQTLGGKTVRRLSTRARASEETSLLWDGRDAQGGALPAGPYVFSLAAKDSRGNQVRDRRTMINLR